MNASFNCPWHGCYISTNYSYMHTAYIEQSFALAVAPSVFAAYGARTNTGVLECKQSQPPVIASSRPAVDAALPRMTDRRFWKHSVALVGFIERSWSSLDKKREGMPARGHGAAIDR